MASIISSLFGVGQQQQQQPAAQVIQQQLPKEVAPFYEKLLKESEALYKQQMEEGAPIYEGKTIAGFTPEQEQLFSGLQGLVGQQAPKFAEAEALTRGTAAKITPDEVQEFMNPYQQAVVDIEKREAQKQFESTVLPQLAAQAVASQGFGGSRQAILEGMAADTQQRLLADIQAKGSAQAYKDAMDQIAAQRQREGAAGQQLAQLAPAGFQAQAQELGAIGKVGDVKQQQAQLALDEAYKQFLQERQFPADALKQFQSVVQQFPNIPTQITRTPPPAQPGLAQTLLGGLATGVGTYGAFGGFSPGGFLGMKQAETGGGIADLPVVYAQQSAYMRDKLSRGRADFQPVLDFISQLSGRKGREGSDLEAFQKRLEEVEEGTYTPKSQEEILAELRAKKSGLESLEGTGEIFKPDTRKFEADPESKTAEQIKAIIASGADATAVGGLPDELRGKSIRVDMTPDPVSKDPMGPPMQPEVNQPGSNIDAAKNVRTGILGQLDKQRGELGKLKVPGAPDTTELDRLQAERRKAKEAQMTDIDKRLADIPEERKKDLFALLAQQGAKFASTPGATLSEAVGGFTKEGRKIFKASEEEKKRLKEQQTNININLFDDDVAQETARVNLKTKAAQNKFDNILKKNAEKIKLDNSEINFMNALANQDRAKAALKTSDAALAKARALPDFKSLGPNQVKQAVDVFELELSKYKDAAKGKGAYQGRLLELQQDLFDAGIKTPEGDKISQKQIIDILDDLKISESKGRLGKDTSSFADYLASQNRVYNNSITMEQNVGSYIYYATLEGIKEGK